MPDDQSDPIQAPPPADPDSPERRALEAEPSTRCLNCGASLPGRFCPNCGQKDQPLRTPIHRYVVDALAEYLGLDGRVWPSLAALLVRPGRLTQAYVRGQRERYVRPLRIYLTSSVLFFLVLGLINPLGRIRAMSEGEQEISPTTEMSAEQYLARLDSLAEVERREDAGNRRHADSLRGIADSLRAAFQADSLSGRFADLDSLDAATEAVAEAESEAEDALEDYEDAHGTTSDRRLAWKREEAAGYPSDSTIIPYDLETAAELVVEGRRDDPDNFGSGMEWLARSGPMQDLKQARTNAQRSDALWALGGGMVEQLPTVIFLLLPVFALLLKVLYVRRGWYYAEHLVFALHVHAFVFVVFTIAALLWWISGGAAWTGAVTSVLGLLIPIYFLVAMKRVYAQGWIKTLVKIYFLSWMYFFVLLGGTLSALVLASLVG